MCSPHGSFWERHGWRVHERLVSYYNFSSTFRCWLCESFLWQLRWFKLYFLYFLAYFFQLSCFLWALWGTLSEFEYLASFLVGIWVHSGSMPCQGTLFRWFSSWKFIKKLSHKAEVNKFTLHIFLCLLHIIFMYFLFVSKDFFFFSKSLVPFPIVVSTSFGSITFRFCGPTLFVLSYI